MRAPQAVTTLPLDTRALSSEQLADILQHVLNVSADSAELDGLLVRLADAAARLARARHARAGLRVTNDDTPAIHILAATHKNDAEVGCCFRSGEGLAGRVLSEAKLIWIAAADGVDAAIGVPLLSNGIVIGFVGVDSAESGAFDPDAAAALTLLACGVAPAVAQAQLLASERQRHARSMAIARVGRAIAGSLDIRTVLQSAVDAIHEWLHYPEITVFMPDPSRPGWLQARAHSGRLRPVAPEYRQPIDVGIVGVAMRTCRVVKVDDVRADPRYVPVPTLSDVRAELAIPLLIDDRALGVLNFETLRPLAPDEVSDLQLVADQLSVAIDNAQKFDDEQRRSARTSMIARVGQRVTARLNMADLIHTVVDDLHKRLGYDHAALFLYEPHDEMLRQAACATRWTESIVVGYRQSINRGVVGAAARMRAPQRVDNVLADPRYVPMSDSETARTELAVPIALGERLLGVIDVAGMTPFRDDDVTSLQILSGQMAVALLNAELFSSTQLALDEQRLLYDTSRQISVAMQVDDVVEAYLRQVAVRGRYMCTVALYEVDAFGYRTALVTHGSWSPADGVTRLQERYAYARDELDPLLDAGQTVAIQDIAGDMRIDAMLREIYRREGRSSMALIPLLARGVRIGLVMLSAETTHIWSDEDLRPYQITAAQLALSIDSRMQQSLVVDRGQRLAVLEERQRLARELHDSVTQLIFSTTLIAQAIAPAWRRSEAEGEKRVARLLELSQVALAEMRALLFELRPTDASAQPSIDGAAVSGLTRVQRGGLAAAIEHYARHITREGLHVRVGANGYRRQIDSVEEALYRVAQEAINNIVKHARASAAAIELTQDVSSVYMRIHDNGCGFDRAMASGGLGLQSMRERVIHFGGAIELITAPDAGTTIRVVLPAREVTGAKAAIELAPQSGDRS